MRRARGAESLSTHPSLFLSSSCMMAFSFWSTKLICRWRKRHLTLSLSRLQGIARPRDRKITTQQVRIQKPRLKGNRCMRMPAPRECASEAVQPVRPHDAASDRPMKTERPTER